MVGRHLLAALAERGVAVAAASRTRPRTLPARARWSAWDLCEWREPDALDGLLGPIDTLFHVGAAVPGRDRPLDDRTLLDANVRACRCLGVWARSRGVRLVFLSGAIVYGESGDAALDESAQRSVTPQGGLYGLSKVLAEQVFENLAPGGLQIVCLRATSIYGTGLDPAKLAAALLIQARDGRTIELDPPVDDRVNLVHAADVARAMILAAQAGVTGVYNIGGPKLATVREIAQTAVAVAGAGAVRIAPTADGRLRAAQTRFDIDGARAASDLGYRAEIDLFEGLSRMLAGTT